MKADIEDKTRQRNTMSIYPDCTRFAKEEYDNRRKRLQATINSKKADALLVHSLSNICWLCGLECVMPSKYFMMIVPAEGEPHLLIESFEVHNARINTHLKEENITQYELYEDYKEDCIEASARLIEKMGLSEAKLLIETHSWSLSVNNYQKLSALIPKACFKDSGMCVEKTRCIKSDTEIEYIRIASKIASDGVMAAVEAAGEGIRDSEIAAAAYASMTCSGSEYMCLPPIVTLGRRSGIPHTTDAGVTVKKGDTVLLEFGANYRRYTGVTMRTVNIGRPNYKVKEMFVAAKRSVENAISKMRPGIDGSVVADSSKQLILKETSKYMWHGCYAYSIGLGFPPSWEDAPVIVKQGDHTVLEQGMVFHTSTTFREIAVHGVTVSETVLITKNGCEVLTSVPRELFIK